MIIDEDKEIKYIFSLEKRFSGLFVLLDQALDLNLHVKIKNLSYRLRYPSENNSYLSLEIYSNSVGIFLFDANDPILSRSSHIMFFDEFLDILEIYQRKNLKELINFI